jgi:nucleotide-binding universal stress UspA family protein
MKLSKILFPTDYSEYEKAALGYASRLASESRAKLLIVHVDEETELNAAMGEAGYLYGAPEEASQKAQRRLSLVRPTLPHVACEHHCLVGPPVAELLKLAEREEVDLIVMGSHGRTGFSRLLMGSVAEGVMRRASCPVLIVKEPAPAVLDLSSVAAEARG